jgi:hypothetical protein
MFLRRLYRLKDQTPVKWRERLLFFLVTVTLVLATFGRLYKPPQPFVFSGQISAGGEQERGTVVRFEPADAAPFRMVTATQGLDGLSSTARMVIRVRTSYAGCQEVEAALPALFREPARLICSLQDGQIQLEPQLPGLVLLFEEPIRVQAQVEGSTQAFLGESGRHGHFPFSREFQVRSMPGQPPHRTGVEIYNQPGVSMEVSVGGVSGRLVPLHSTPGDQMLHFVVEEALPAPQTSQPASTMKFLYTDPVVSFSGDFRIRSLCLERVNGRMGIGGQELGVVLTEVWKVTSTKPGQLSIVNWEVISSFDQATRLGLLERGCDESIDYWADQRRTWLEMRPFLLGAVGFVLAALLSSLLNWLLQSPKEARREENNHV